jgi:2'-hydroxyisoflavone reductase
MKLLIIGGTRFLGRAIVEEALSAGHEVTLFNRGQSNPELFPAIEHLQGDRDGGLDALKGRQWDAVIDTCGYLPRLVRASAAALRDSVEHYTFISTISVYAESPVAGMDENAPLGTIDDETVEEITAETYGPLKVLCERATEETMDGRALVVRSGLIAGPHDPTDRFTYWPARIARGGEILAPVGPDLPVQFIDARDIARWTVLATVKRLTGPYNITGPAERLTLGELLETCIRITASDAQVIWVEESFLINNQVTPFMQLPLWVPSQDIGISQVSIHKALRAGLSFRPLAETIRDTLAWAGSRPDEHSWRSGLTPEHETGLLAAWHQRHNQDD